MSFETIDPVILPWARRVGLRWDLAYRDEPCRQMFFGGVVGPRVQMAATSVPEDVTRARVFLAFWATDGDPRAERRQYEGTLDELPGLLDQAHAQARTWLGKHPLTLRQRLGRVIGGR